MFDQSKMAAEEASSSCSWSREEDEAFENAVADYPDDAPDRFEKIAAAVPGKTAEDIRKHYEVLVEDVMAIEAGRVPLPNYTSTSEGSADHGGNSRRGGGDSAQSGRASRADQERRKGIAWTEEEHRLFLLGLDKYGKGDWRSISRNFVISRTPTQVASHAQKYFIRLNSMNKDRRRTSIHDITTVGSGGDVTAPQGPITGQANGPAPAKPAKNSAHPVVGVYGTTIGQPVGGPHLTAVGTPVGSHMAYGVRAPGTMVPGAPVNLAPMTYPMPRTSSSAQR